MSVTTPFALCQAEVAALLDDPAVLVWDGFEPAPDGAEHAAVWVPPYGVGQDAAWIEAALGALPSLRVVQLLSAGVEPWATVLAARADAPLLCAGRRIHGASTAELAVALLLSGLRELPRYAEQQAQRVWRRHEPTTLAGRRVLVLGAGDIGERVAASLRPLDAEVALVARTARPGVLTWADARDLLPRTDALIVALPHTPETDGLVDAAVLASLPDGAWVVNVARGALVDQVALAAEAASGRLRVAVDVTVPEPLPTTDPLWTSGAVVTPHVAGGATGWQERAARLVADQLVRIRAGQEPAHVVRTGY